MKAAKPSINLRILGKPWRLRLLTRRQYKKRHGDDSLGVTKAWKREIDLSPQGRDLETIIHEVVHGFLHEMCAKGTIESEAGLEEFFCELLARRGEEVLALARSAHAKIKQLTKGGT